MLVRGDEVYVYHDASPDSSPENNNLRAAKSMIIFLIRPYHYLQTWRSLRTAKAALRKDDPFSVT
jgi:hypothetical protein